jgi:hypothetical protein
MTSFVVAHPLACTAGASLVGLAVAAFVLRFEVRHQLRERRYGGFLVGGDR